MEMEDKSIKDEFIVTSFKLPKSLRKKIKEIAVREERDIQDIVKEKLEEYVKIHGDGNPVYTLEKFQDPNFKITPALFSSSDKLIKYYQSILTEKEMQELDRQLNLWVNIHNKRFRELR